MGLTETKVAFLSKVSVHKPKYYHRNLPQAAGSLSDVTSYSELLCIDLAILDA